MNTSLLTPQQISEVENRTPAAIRGEREVVLNALKCVVGTTEVAPAWFGDEWSRTWQLTGDEARRWFLKMTPRRRTEAKLLLQLTALMPGAVPTVIASDVLPRSARRWFLCEDAGWVSGDFDLEQACAAAQALGALQRQCALHPELSLLVPHCGPLSLLDCVLEAVSDAAHNEKVQALGAALKQRRAFWNALSVALLELPPTLVHGDFWMGNVARRAEGVCFLDWGDAVWGAGGVSLVHFMARHNVAEEEARQLWEAYAGGWQREISRVYRCAAIIAQDIAELVIRAEIRACCQLKNELPEGNFDAMIKVLERLNSAQV